MSEQNEKGVVVEETSRRLSDASTLVPAKEDDLQKFTATGRPMHKDRISGLASSPANFTPMAVQNLPWKFTDDDLISVPIPVPDSSADGDDTSEHAGSTTSLGSKVKHAFMYKGKSKGKKSPKFRVVKMTRGEYLKYWARDEHGNYIGTEPEGLGEELWKNRI